MSPHKKRSKTTDDAAPPGGVVARGGKVDPEALRAQVEANALDQLGDEESDAEEQLAHVSFTLARDLNKRLDRYLTDRITFLSRNQLQRLVEAGAVLVNGREAKPSTKLRVGDVVDVSIPPPPPKDIQPEAIPINVLYEDEHLLVLNKQPDLIVHPARSHHAGTLLNGLVHHFAQQGAGALSAVGKDVARPGVVHRLDRNTSGVMVVAKDDLAHWKLAGLFERRQVDKRYLALVEGVMEIDADIIEAPLGPSPSRVKGQREKMVVRHDELGKQAITLYRVRQRFPLDTPEPIGQRGVRGYTLVELELKTGRTHQIRVHLSNLGYPIAGDDMYGGHNIQHVDIGNDTPGVALARQALHACVLAFRHPITGAPVTFTAPVPHDFAAVVRALRAMHTAGPIITPPGATIDLAQALP
ncbi:MAG: RluA family pseudouridine synthase [Phycisphaerales bacterium]|nr:RluA family pseudouridine synthase [Phycisphaerales bacterium]